MRKHIFGLVFFSFIVGAAAFIYAVFNVPKIVEVHDLISTSQYVSTDRTHCNKGQKTKLNSIEIKQSVLDLQTKQFNWELATPDVNEPIALYFFSKDASGETRLIATERINNKFSYNGVLKFSNSYGWLNKRKSYRNLYVMAQFELKSNTWRDDDSIFFAEPVQPKFDAAKATAVTVDYGK